MLQFYIVHNDKFHTVTRSGSNTLPPNWKEAFNTDHYAEDPSFDTPFQATINDKKISLKVQFANNKDEEDNISEGAASSMSVSEGVSIPASEGAIDSVSTNEDISNQSLESDGSITQLSTRSGKVSMRPKRFI